jgi:hypothetical protein
MKHIILLYFASIITSFFSHAYLFTQNYHLAQGVFKARIRCQPSLQAKKGVPHVVKNRVTEKKPSTRRVSSDDDPALLDESDPIMGIPLDNSLNVDQSSM